MPESRPSRGSSLLSRTPSYLVSATGCRIALLHVIFNRSLLVVDEPMHRELEAWLCTFLSWSAARGLVHSNIRPQGILGLHETLRAGGVRARELGRIHAMGLSVRSCVIQSSRPGENLVSSRMIPQAQQMGSSVGAMNVSLLGAEGASRVVRVLVFSIDIKHIISLPAGDGLCDTGL